MSSGISTTKKSAMAYNAKAAKSVGWGDRIPCGLIGQYPNLGQAPDSELFALLWRAFKRIIGSTLTESWDEDLSACSSSMIKLRTGSPSGL